MRGGVAETNDRQPVFPVGPVGGGGWKDGMDISFSESVGTG